ncbi:D-alanyl-D-alanine carboxypeptidase [bacterium]|nr:D-alanyl-D-alanine carboxypeptidase [bacterium]
MFSRLIVGVAATAAILRVLLAATPVAAMPDPPEVAARAALVMDARNGRVLWERNGEVALPPASTTKIMTSILALESGMLNRDMEVSSYAASQPPSKLGLKAGQEVRLRDLVYALMLKSANDAAVVVAEGLSGSVRSFAARMNLKARQIGARNTFFTNPSGLPDDDHRSSAHDLALMLRYAMTVSGFRTIASTKSAFVPVEGRTVRMVPISSHNRLLDNYVVQVFGKTGYTRAAGKCFVGAAEIDGRAVMVAVLGSTNVWGDTRKLIEYGLNQVAPQSVAGLDFGTGSGGTWDRDDRDERDEVEIPSPPPSGMRWAAAAPAAAPDADRVARAWASAERFRGVDPAEERRRADEAAERAALAAERASAREAREERAAVLREQHRIRLAVAREQRRLVERAKAEAAREARADRLAREADARADREARAKVERLARAGRPGAARHGRADAPAAISRAERERIERLVRADRLEARKRPAKDAQADSRVAAVRPGSSARSTRPHEEARRAAVEARSATSSRAAAASRPAKVEVSRTPSARSASARRPVAQGDSDEGDSGSKAKRGSTAAGRGAAKQVSSTKAVGKPGKPADKPTPAKTVAKAGSKAPAKAPARTARR